MKIFKKVLFAFFLLAVALAVFFYSGPKIPSPQFKSHLPEIPADILTISNWVSEKENLVRQNGGEVKENNEAQIIWQDTIPQKTKYAIVYIHGFGASQQEGYPVHEQLADSLKANLFLSRQIGHGLANENAFEGITAETYMESAMEALAIGEKIGDQLILIGTSTGAAQALWLAANFPEKVRALILYSPYISLVDTNSEKLILGPWGKQIAQYMIGGDVNREVRPDSVAAYWSEYYHIDAYFALFNMIHAITTTEIYQKVKCPVLMAYYYKNENEQDDVVSVAAMTDMFKQLNTTHKKSIAFPAAGNHVIASDLRSKDWAGVRDSTLIFMNNILRK